MWRVWNCIKDILVNIGIVLGFILLYTIKILSSDGDLEFNEMDVESPDTPTKVELQEKIIETNRVSFIETNNTDDVVEHISPGEL